MEEQCFVGDVWKQFEQNPISHSAAHHIVAIVELLERHGYARVSDVAKLLNITRGSASLTLKALKVRTLIKQDFDRALERVDCIAAPVSPTTAFPIGEKVSDPLTMYLGDIYTISLNLAGLPGLAMPCGFDDKNLPVGVQLLKEEGVVLAGVEIAFKVWRQIVQVAAVPQEVRVIVVTANDVGRLLRLHHRDGLV